MPVLSRAEGLYALFRHNGRESYGVIEGDSVSPFDGDLFGPRTPAGASLPLSAVGLLAPIRPGKILAAAVNYPSHVPSARTVLKQDEPPAIPQFFLKPSSSIIRPDEAIVLPES